MDDDPKNTDYPPIAENTNATIEQRVSRLEKIVDTICTIQNWRIDGTEE